ncbi:transmembrane protein 120B isoform X2 [Equus quagga]|uniref:transmembrane protein 120B isoform X2 n=1 Tax=Equus quagga TaxID=89248 RepID=UPI001D04BE1B|nr:transmembrane protein 120B isoform X5 [Equus asinus]XP_046495918.1 transmembrane protein 120B isoform X2 [Equus quagga]
MSGQLERCEREWHELEGEFQELQETHRIYKQKLEELTALQTLCSSSINKQKTRLKDLKHTLQRYKHHASREEAELVQQMGASIKERQNIFFDMEAYLPKKNGLYLNLVLGNVNVTLLSNQAKFAYKDEYEKFKLYLTIILLLGAVMCRFVLHYRVTDEVFNFLLVWYYCTLTIRESILISNGSRLCPVPAILLPEGLPLPAAGPGGEESPGPHEGFQSWMWRGLTFLLPFLFCGHFWQLYNAVTLFELSSHEECKEWQSCTPNSRRTEARQRSREPPDCEAAGGSQSAPSLPISSPTVSVATDSSDLRGQWHRWEQD